MKSIWNRIRAEINLINPKLGNSFNEPAIESEIKLLNSFFDNKIPIDFIKYLNVFNGQSHNNFDIQPFSYYSFIPIKEIVDIIKIQNKLWESEEKINWINENKIQPKVWDKLWLPIASESTSYLIIDLNPGKNGVYGQVFQLFSGMDYEQDNVVLANSFLEFSTLLQNKLIDKNYEIEEDEPIIVFKDNWI